MKMMEEVEESGEKRDEEEGWEDILATGQIFRKILKTGDGEKAEKNKRALVSVVGKLEDGTLVHSDSDLSLWVGNYDVIQAIDMVVQLMSVGEINAVRTSPRFAFGSDGRSPDIPPDASLNYEIELKQVDDGPNTSAFDQMAEFCEMRKKRGNELYAMKFYDEATIVYRKSLLMLDEYLEGRSLTPDEKHTLAAVAATISNNLGASQLKNKSWDDAIESLDICIGHDPENSKAHFRKAKALKEKGELHLAVLSLEKAKKFDPNSSMINRELYNVSQELRRGMERERRMYEKMIQGIEKPSRLSLTKLVQAILFLSLNFPQNWKIYSVSGSEE